MYKDEWEVLVGNCDSQIFLGGADQTTLDYISKALGKETIRSINNSRSWGRQSSSSTSYNKTGRELMTADELRVMNNKDCIVFIRGEYPFYSQKYDLKKHPNYKRTGDASDKYLFDVKKMLQTGENMASFDVKDNLPLKVFTEAQIADTREADRMHRHRSRPIETHSVRGQEMLRVKPLNDVMPGIGIPPEQRTPEQERILAAAQGDYAFDGLNTLSEKEMTSEYQNEILDALYGGPEISNQ